MCHVCADSAHRKREKRNSFSPSPPRALTAIFRNRQLGSSAAALQQPGDDDDSSFGRQLGSPGRKSAIEIAVRDFLIFPPSFSTIVPSGGAAQQQQHRPREKLAR